MTMRMECMPHLHLAPVPLKRSPMLLDRRSLLALLCWIAASPALAADAQPELETYERESGGRIGVYAENLATGAKLAWRADERFVMCSTFKASLAGAGLYPGHPGAQPPGPTRRLRPQDPQPHPPGAQAPLGQGGPGRAGM